jgi:hypothetical protein
MPEAGSLLSGLQVPVTRDWFIEPSIAARFEPSGDLTPPDLLRKKERELKNVIHIH